jgi:predicted DNA-binding transcriptional regulator YafY
MSKKNALKRQLLIINKLSQKPCSFAELRSYLKNESQNDEENYQILIRTFQRELVEIRSIFDKEIKYNRKERVYELIENENPIQNERLLEAFMVLDILQTAQKHDDDIIFEQRKALGLKNVFILLHAIKNKLEITFEHQKYWEDFSIKKRVQPFLLKESKNRWYLIALDISNNQIRTYGLDRISEITITKIKFAKPSKSFIEKKFKNSFGVIFDENEAQKVILQLSTFQANYIKSLPLHQTQKIVSEDENYCIISLEVYPTYDFIMEILSMGKELKVLQPANLVERIKSLLTESINNYQ